MSIETIQASIEQWSVKLVRERKRTYVAQRVDGPDALHPLLSWMCDEAEEKFVAVYLNARLEPIGMSVVSHGTATCSLVHPREVFKGAILANAYAVIVAHNHPSGDTTPSEDDDKTTRQLIQAGALLNIQVLDHIIVGDRYYHYRERKDWMWAV